MSKDLSALTKEELIALLQKQSQKQAETEEKLRESKRQVKLYKDATVQLRQQLALKGKLQAGVCEQLDIVEQVLGDLWKTFAFDPNSVESILDSLSNVTDAFVKYVQKNKAFFLSTTRGSEKLLTRKMRKERNDANNRLKKDLEKQKSREEAIMKSSTRRAFKEVSTLYRLTFTAESEAAKSEGEKDIRAALSQPIKEPQDKPTKSSAGRVKTDQENLPAIHAPFTAEAPQVCPDCGKPMRRLGGYSETMRSIESLAGQIAARLEQQVEIHGCGCGHAEVVCDKDAHLPVFPERTLGMPMLLTLSGLQTMGLPLNKISEIFLSDLQIGGETLYRNVRDLYKYYLEDIVEAIKGRMSENPVIEIDETYFDCLENQGKGIRPSSTPRSKSLILAARSPRSAAKPFVWYGFLPTRSAASIKSVLGPAIKPEVLVSDAYAGYDSLLKDEQLKGTSHQVCLIHFRRTALQALDSHAFEKKINSYKTEKELLENLNKMYRSEDPQVMLMAVLRDITAISALESKLKREPQETEEEFFARAVRTRSSGDAENAKFYMDRIDRIMKRLADREAEQCNGRWQEKQGKIFGKPCVYYMNHRDELRYFLQDGRVQSHTNDVERGIRNLAVLRKNSNFMQTIEGIEVVCGFQTLWENAELYGIDPLDWLINYTRRRSLYCQSEAWSTVYRKSVESGGDIKNANTRLKYPWQEEWNNLSRGFNLSEWLPWNYGKALK